MILLFGLSGKVKDCGDAQGAGCPVCGSVGTLRVCNKYMTPTIFFIPTFRFRNSYFATCAHCASVMEVDRQKGRDLAAGRPTELFPSDLQVIQDNALPVCGRCGQRAPRGSSYCNGCGAPL